jgi:hypothetical protein
MEEGISVSNRMNLTVALTTTLLTLRGRYRPEVASFNADWTNSRGAYYGR